MATQVSASYSEPVVSTALYMTMVSSFVVL